MCWKNLYWKQVSPQSNLDSPSISASLWPHRRYTYKTYEQTIVLFSQNGQLDLGRALWPSLTDYHVMCTLYVQDIARNMPLSERMRDRVIWRLLLGRDLRDDRASGSLDRMALGPRATNQAVSRWAEVAETTACIRANPAASVLRQWCNCSGYHPSAAQADWMGITHKQGRSLYQMRNGNNDHQVKWSLICRFLCDCIAFLGCFFSHSDGIPNIRIFRCIAVIH